jgi:hypothetical protein
MKRSYSLCLTTLVTGLILTGLTFGASAFAANENQIVRGYLMPMSSTSNMRVLFGGMMPVPC